MRRLFAALLPLASVAAAERPFTVEDLLSMQTYGQVMAASRAGLLLVERRRPYRDAADYGQGGAFVDRMLDVVLAVPTRSPDAGLKPLFHQERDAGYWMGSLSPSGRRLSVFRLRNRVLSLGVVDLDRRTATWLDVRPDLLSRDPAPVWLDEDRLLVAETSDGGLPRVMRLGSAAGARLADLYAAQARGDASWTGFSTRGGGAPRQGRLVEIDVGRSTRRIVFEGEVVDFAVAHGGAVAAVVEAGAPVPPPAGPIGVSFGSRRRPLSLIRLRDGRRIGAAADVAPGLLSWSPAGRLLVAVREGGARTWRESRFVSFDRRGRSVVLGGAGDAAFAPEPADALRFSAAWTGRRALAFVNHGAGPSEWRSLSLGRSTGVSVPRTATLVAHDGTTAVLRSRSGTWHVDASGAMPLPPDAQPLVSVSLDPFAAGDRGDARPCGRAALAVPSAHRTRVDPADADCPAIVATPAGEDVLAAPPEGVVSRRVDAKGVETLLLTAPDGSRTVVDAINRPLASIASPRTVRLETGEAAGRKVVHWLVLPPAGHVAPRLVVQPYPGRTFGATSPVEARPWRNGLGTNALLLAGAGFAVLMPGMPRSADRNPVDDVVPQVEAAVAAARATGLVDQGAWSVMGHSFGGWAAMVIATRKPCLGGVVAANGVYDLVAAHATMAGPDRIDLGQGIPFGSSTGWAEAGQGAMRATPSEARSAYASASPILRADGVSASVLLVGGDLDPVDLSQTERMFMEIARRGGDARLLRFWGEGHTVSSPENLRSYWRRAIDVLGSPPPPGCMEGAATRRDDRGMSRPSVGEGGAPALGTASRRESAPRRPAGAASARGR